MPAAARHRESAPSRSEGARVGVVLAGGAARGAYEAGVVAHVIEEVSRDLGHDVPIDVLCGTSVGAINACALAAHADEPRLGAARLTAHWASLRISDVVRVNSRSILDLISSLLSQPASMTPVRPRGVIDPTSLRRLLTEAIPFGRIGEQIAARRLHALALAATEVSSGHSVVWVQRAGDDHARLPASSSFLARSSEISIDHAMASAAVPFAFPALEIGGAHFCDGGLGQNVPLAPARSLGANRLLVVNPRGAAAGARGGPRAPARPWPVALLGKVVNALLADRTEDDVQALDRAIHIYPTRDVAELAAQFARSPELVARTHGAVGRLVRWLANSGGSLEAELLSYLLFDGEFARLLIELGRADARARHEDLCRLFEEAGVERRRVARAA